MTIYFPLSLWSQKSESFLTALRTALFLGLLLFVGDLKANIEREALIRCASHPVTSRSSSCLQWTSLAAINSLSSSPQCHSHVHVPLLMCIFREEIGSFERYAESGDDEDKYCGENGCGLSQMTGDGVKQVKSALQVDELMEAWKNYWQRLPHNLKDIKSPETLARKDAMDPFYGVMMASLHLCNEIRAMENRQENISVYKLAYHYNGHPKYQTHYASSVERCVKNNSWRNTPSPKPMVAKLEVNSKNNKSSGRRAHSASRQKVLDSKKNSRRNSPSKADGLGEFFLTESERGSDGRVHTVIPMKRSLL